MDLIKNENKIITEDEITDKEVEDGESTTSTTYRVGFGLSLLYLVGMFGIAYKMYDSVSRSLVTEGKSDDIVIKN
ncbi:MAG: hypothetical protein PHF17_03915 [Arcobacteraceae bacterium]|nr:hypothetical protein [Arcobacteraceae bacterium]